LLIADYQFLVPIADLNRRLNKIGNQQSAIDKRQSTHSPKVRVLQLVMSRFFIGDDFSALEVLDD